MIDKLEFSDINRYFVSVGTILIALGFLLPYFYLKENFGIIISEADYNSYTEISRKIIDNKQNNVLFFQNIILYISGLFLITGFIFSTIGIIRWNKRQSKIDKKFDKELEKLEIEIKQLTPEEKEEKIQEEIKYTTETEENQPNTSNTTSDYRNIRTLYENAEQTIIEKIKSNDLIRNLFEILTEIKINNKYIDVLLKGKEKDIIVEIKFLNRSLNSIFIRDFTQKLDYTLETYKKSLNRNVIGKLLVVYNDNEINNEQLNRTLERIKNNNFHSNYLNTVDIQFIKNSELKDLEIKNII
ncbi:MAG: hypothetical protein C0412_20400 [Flavobacterium sp.]|nr:hypothetical protein [Flavobacterium sp.]